MNLATASASASLAGSTALLNNGTLVFYSGTQPTTPETALSGNTALATWTFSATAFGAASFSGGYEQQTASFTASQVTPSANGTVTFARLLKSDGTTVVMDLTVGTSGTDIIIASTTISTAIQVSIALTLKMPAS